MMKKLRLKPVSKKFENREKIILRDFLAMERTSLANERTLFSYIRASLYLAIAAFAILEVRDLGNLTWLGYSVLGLSVILVVVGLYRYYKLRKKLATYYLAMNINPQDQPEKSERPKE